MKDSGWDKQTAQPKNGVAIQSHDKINFNSPADKSAALKKVPERAKKDKQKKAHKDRQKCQKRSILATRSNNRPLFGKNQKTLVKLFVSAAITRAITQKIVPSLRQKTSSSFGNLHIDDCK